MKVNEIRKSFLDFFENKGHLIQDSYPLVPINDKSLLLINAGMAPLKNYFIGVETPPATKMATCQKCIRTGDIENVGRTARHATFFEMLGNFSFGDYFKKEATAWAWEYVTEYLKLDPSTLWISVYEEDDEALEIWATEIGIDRSRLVKLGKADNFWEIGTGTGPCGPCSEIYIDRGEKFGCGDEACAPGCDCDRFLEFWNLVFTQYDKDESGNYNLLANPNIDTGMGLERIACIMQGVDSIFDIDTMKAIRDEICKKSGKIYNESAKQDVSIRIITDHIRAVTFMICDGILPSNEGRGYILRRLLRRAARHGKLLGIQEDFLFSLCETVMAEFGEAYPQLIEKKDYIIKLIGIEEQKFNETIDQGLSILEGMIEELKASNKTTLDGKNAFKLYDTFGFPVEMTEEILEESGLALDYKEFTDLMENQKQMARSARAQNENQGWKKDESANIPTDIETSFLGYNEFKSIAKVLYIQGEDGNGIGAGEKGMIILEASPFYGEGGGQVGDTGIISGKDFEANVYDTKKGPNSTILHLVEVRKGTLSLGDEVLATVDIGKRKDIQNNHSATHLLHKALKMVLGNHAAQAGSLVDDQKLRFDFNHFEGMTIEEIQKVEDIVNEEIFASLNVKQEFMDIESAKKKGATAQFDEKYGDKVRVVSMGDFSMELCGGTHVNNTAEILSFKIISESGVASGIRRIEGITGRAVRKHINEKELKLKAITDILKCNESLILTRLEQIVEESKLNRKEIEKLKVDIALSKVGELIETAANVKGTKAIVKVFQGMNNDDLRNTAEILVDKDDTLVVVLASPTNEKINYVCAVGKSAQVKGAHAGKIVKEIASIAGGGGGGKPNFAQAGGKNPDKLQESVEAALGIITGMINE